MKKKTSISNRFYSKTPHLYVGIAMMLVSLSSYSQDSEREKKSQNAHLTDTLRNELKLNKVDSPAIHNEANLLKDEFQKDLEGSLNGLVLTDLDKDDLSNRVDKLLNSYQKKERYQQVAAFDENLYSRLSSFGKNEVTEEWLSNKVSYTRIFEEYPPEVYKDKTALKQNLKKLKKLSDEKERLMEKEGMDKSILNDYHKYLKRQKTIDDLERDVKQSKDYKSNKANRRKYKKFLKEVRDRDTKEQQTKKEIKENKYVEYLQKEHGEVLDYLKDYNEAGGVNEKLVYSKLDEYVKNDDIGAILNNSFVSDYINGNQPDFGKVGAGVIKREVLQALDASGEKWQEKAAAIKGNSEKVDKEEVQELLVKNAHEKKLLPENAFFEGIVAFGKGDFSVFSLSPNFGYEFKNGPSVGLGVTFHHTQDKEAYIRSVLDYKAFAKYEMFKKIIFLQAEYVAMIPGMSYLEAKEGAVEFRNTVLVGGGFSVKIKGKKTLSLGIMYNLNQNMGVPTYDSPILARFGVKLF